MYGVLCMPGRPAMADRWPWPLRPNEPGEVPVLGGVDPNDGDGEPASACAPGMAMAPPRAAGAWNGWRRGDVMGGMEGCL